MNEIKLFSGEQIPLEMHKTRIVQKLNLLDIDARVTAIKKAGFNTFLLHNKDVFLDMLTDSGVNAMSDKQQAAMLIADDSYAGSESFYRFEKKLQDIFGMDYILPAHQGRACENIIAKVLVKEGSIVPMNFHFTTTKSHIMINGGQVEELIIDEGLNVSSSFPFKGNMDINKLETLIKSVGKENIPFVRMEAGTNLIGGQPFSLKNLKEVQQVCLDNDLLLVLDASLLSDNLHFIKTKEEHYQHTSIKEIAKEIGECCDIIYFSARKLGAARGGGLCIRDKELFDQMKELITLYEGFLTYGGMSVREIEAITVGLEETMDENVINQGPQFIKYMCQELERNDVPIVTPPGGLGCHLDAMRFVPQIPQSEYPAGALAAALYAISGIRSMERGTLSEQRNADGTEHLSSMELVRLALPRRVFTMSQIKYAVDRISWLYKNKHLIGGLRFTEEPEVLRFFFGRLEPTTNWLDKLIEKFKADIHK